MSQPRNTQSMNKTIIEIKQVRGNFPYNYTGMKRVFWLMHPLHVRLKTCETCLADIVTQFMSKESHFISHAVILFQPEMIIAFNC